MPPKFDKRILKPGWVGEPETGELELLTKRLIRDQRLASRWGFTLNSKQTDWAILQVAMLGERDCNFRCSDPELSSDTH
jgi:hypothetical protein